MAPAAAAEDPAGALARAGGIRRRRAAVVTHVVAVPAPLGHVAVHVVEAPGVGLLRPDRMGRAGGVVGTPGVGGQRLDVLAAAPARLAAGAAGVLPFGLGRQTVARPAPYRDGVALAYLVVRRQAVPLAETVAEAHRLDPRYRLDRPGARVGALDLFLVAAPLGEGAGVGAHHLLELLLRDLGLAQAEGAGDGDGVPRPFVLRGVPVGVGRAHLELASGHQHHVDDRRGRLLRG